MGKIFFGEQVDLQAPWLQAEGMSPLHAALLWSHLQVLTKDRYYAVLEVFGNLEEAAAHISEEFLKSLGCREETIRAALIKLEEFDAALVEAQMQMKGVELIALNDPRYPRKLLEIGDPPVFLSFLGDLSALEPPGIGLVGTRQMSPYGKRVTQHFVPEFVRAGMVTVSGLAQGIDAEVAEETIRAGGKTIAVLAHGLSTIYPKSNIALAEKIIQSGGLLLTEFPFNVFPEKYTFPARNRIIAGLSVGTVVLQAPEGSGALITAELALEYSREVFAVPGQIFDPQYEGCHRLLQKDQAHIAVDPGDVLRELGIVAPEAGSQPSSYIAKNPQEEAILRVLSSMPQSIDTLVERSALPAPTVAATLTLLELSGIVKNAGGGQWVLR